MKKAPRRAWPRISSHGLRAVLVLAMRRNERSCLVRHRLLAHARCRRLHAYDRATAIVHQIVVVVTQPSRSSALVRIGRIGIGGRYQCLLMHWLFGWILLLQFHRCWRTVCFTCVASANCSRGMRLSLLALASTKLPSTERRSPLTSPASKQRATISSNSCSNSFDSWSLPSWHTALHSGAVPHGDHRGCIHRASPR